MPSLRACGERGPSPGVSGAGSDAILESDGWTMDMTCWRSCWMSGTRPIPEGDLQNTPLPVLLTVTFPAWWETRERALVWCARDDEAPRGR